jgi:RNA recognition motif-containing protein
LCILEAEQINAKKVAEKLAEMKPKSETEVKPQIDEEMDNKEGIDTLPGNEDLSAFQIADRTKRTVFVGNIPLDLAPKKLWYVFKSSGKVEKIWFRSIAPSTMITDRRNIIKGKMLGNQKNSKNAYILFENVESVENALKLNGHTIHNSDFTKEYTLRVDKDEKKDNDFTSTVFVGNLPFIVSEDELRVRFQNLGEIENIRIVRHAVTLIGVGIAFIQFKTKEDAMNCVKLCASEPRYAKFKGRELRVKKATPEERRDRKVKRMDEKKRVWKEARKDREERYAQNDFVRKVFVKDHAREPDIQNDIKMKKDKKKRMMDQMLRGKTSLRDGSRKYITSKIDWHVSF